VYAGIHVCAWIYVFVGINVCGYHYLWGYRCLVVLLSVGISVCVIVCINVSEYQCVLV